MDANQSFLMTKKVIEQVRKLEINMWMQFLANLSAGKAQKCVECRYCLEHLATDIGVGMQYLH
ncbi:hypothetical protein [Shewanella marina]|uniref:hypothetical protein n=1 Tax=Shewanella marina TaxID=487319 RepID=UPI0011DCEB3A|nr:hypothetical protein [Shewanella marina]